MNQANAYGVWHIARLEFFTLKVTGLEVEGCNLLPELLERLPQESRITRSSALRNSIHAEGNEIIISFRTKFQLYR